MSIGKSSIARAAATNSNTKKVAISEKNKVFSTTQFDIEKINLLSGAPLPTQDDLAKLKDSIKSKGLLCPVLIAVTQKKDAWLIDGYHRLYAMRELGLLQINAVIINVENKNEVNRIYKEICSFKTASKSEDIHEEKFRVLAVKDHDLPAYLL